MIGHLFRRTLQSLPLLLILAVLNFLLIHLAPGDPVTFLVGEAGADPAYIAQLRERLGLDRSLPEQLVLYLKNLAQGDLGYSFYYSRPVLELFLERLPATLLLMGSQLLIAFALALPLGIVAARKRHSLTDNLISAGAVMAFSLPVFWSGLMAILLFAVKLQFLPSQGMVSLRESKEGLAHWLDVSRHLLLPALTLALVHMALITRILRASMIDELAKEYVTTARAKGLREAVVLTRHVLRNSLLPVVTVLGLYSGEMLAGAVVTETIFGWPGIGRLMFESIARRDYPVIMGGFLLSSAGVVLGNLLADLLYGVLDPRIRLGANRG